MRPLLAFLLVPLVALAVPRASADVPSSDAGATCQRLDPDSFAAFVAENRVALVQVHHGPDAEVLAVEVPTAIRNMKLAMGYATLDAAVSGNHDLVAKLDRAPNGNGGAPEFFVFRSGLPHGKLPRLKAGLSQEAVEETLVFVSLEATSVADTLAEQAAGGVGQAEGDFPLWSVRHAQDNFKEVFLPEDFDAAMEGLGLASVTVVQFFSRGCKYCQEFSFEWHKVVQYFAGMQAVDFVRVDGGTKQNLPLLERFGVNGFPTIKLFVGGKYEETFAGERKADELQKAVMRLLESSAVRVRRPDGTFNLQGQLPALLRNLERLYSAGALTEEQYLQRFKRLQRANAVTE
jgi:hypothetical protein